jgi:geranylgeranyl diphosphate synthase type I
MANPTLTRDPQLAVTGGVDRILADFLDDEITALAGIDPALVPFAEVIRDLVNSGGKRLRPTFGYWGWRGAAGPDGDVEPVLPALAALELLHTFALIHDDVMDGSALRRGQPTAHQRYAAQHRVPGRRRPAEHRGPAEHRDTAERFGTASAILAGDLCLIWADRLMSTAAVSASARVAARREYDAMRVEAVAGQYLDILGEATPGRWSLPRAMTVARYKTACYTVSRPLRFGATRAGSLASPYHDRYGFPVGEAFQLRDDLLGVYGDPATTGKPAGDDLRQGKPTALLLLARHLSTAAEWNAIQEPAALARLITRSGARAGVEEMIGERVRAAEAAIAEAPVHDAVRTALLHLARLATARER